MKLTNRKFILTIFLGTAFLLGIGGIYFYMLWQQYQAGSYQPPWVISDLSHKGEKGDLEAAFKLWNHYLANKNWEKSLYWLRKAAALGDIESQRELYNLLKFSNDNKLKSEALFNLEKAANNGSISAMSQLAELKWEGKETKKDLQEAKKWFRHAAILSDPFAMVSLSDLLVEYYTDRKSIQEAYAWLKIASIKLDKGPMGSKLVEKSKYIKDKATKMGVSDLELEDMYKDLKKELKNN